MRTLQQVAKSVLSSLDLLRAFEFFFFLSPLIFLLTKEKSPRLPEMKGPSITEWDFRTGFHLVRSGRHRCESAFRGEDRG